MTWSSASQRAPATRVLGLLASVGIVKGKPFEPDARIRRILEEAIAVGNAAARTVTFAHAPRRASPSTRTPSGPAPCSSAVRVPGPAPGDHRQGPRRRPERGARKLNSPDQLLLHGHRDHARHVHAPDRDRLAIHLCDAATAMARTSMGARGYRLTLPADIPESRFWSVMLLRPPDPLDAPAWPAHAIPRQPGRARSRRTPTALRTSTSGRRRPAGKEHNWLQTVPGKGWWTFLRLYNPLESFFDKTWRAERDRARLDAPLNGHAGIGSVP